MSKHAMDPYMALKDFMNLLIFVLFKHRRKWHCEVRSMMVVGNLNKLLNNIEEDEHATTYLDPLTKNRVVSDL